MTFGPERLARGRIQNKIGLGRALFRRGRRLWEVLQRHVLYIFLLRVGSLLEGGIVRSKLESITFPQAPQRFLIRRSNVCNRITTRQSQSRRYSRVTTYDASRPKFGRTFFPIRRGGRLSKGLAGITASLSPTEEGERAPSSSESSTRSTSLTFARFVEARDIMGATDADSSGASTNSRPGYSPSSGWGG
jgi:hypothetical protein